MLTGDRQRYQQMVKCHNTQSWVSEGLSDQGWDGVLSAEATTNVLKSTAMFLFSFKHKTMFLDRNKTAREVLFVCLHGRFSFKTVLFA